MKQNIRIDEIMKLVGANNLKLSQLSIKLDRVLALLLNDKDAYDNVTKIEKHVSDRIRKYEGELK